jgi:hypothetical protein
MNRFFKMFVFLTAVLFAFSVNADEIGDLKDAMKDIQDRIDDLEESAEASGTAGWWTRTSVGGYGELHYNNNNGSGKIDFHRYVLFIGHQFNDSVAFNSEFELEHSIAGEGKAGEIELEQAYLDHNWGEYGLPNTNMKYGVFLIPCGITNEIHEPPTFYGVERNVVEKEICSNTRWEGGIQVNHVIPDMDLTIIAGVHSSLTTSNGDIRGGRDKVASATMNKESYSGAIRYTGAYPGLELGFSWDYEPDMNEGQSGPQVTGKMFAVHANYMPSRGFGSRAFYGQWNLDCPPILTDANQCAANGRDYQWGGFVEGSYRFDLTGEQSMGLMVRRAEWDDKAGTKNASTTKNNITMSTLGINWWLTDQAVLKADWERKKTFGSTAVQGFNMGMGYSF